jgi:hypothetical protein
VQLWSPPHDAPHLLEWWRPLLLVGARTRAERIFWPVHVDEFRLAGRVVRKGRPDVWIYEHHVNGGTICADATGQTYAYTATPKSKAPGRFTACTLRRAVWQAGLPDVVEPVSYVGREPVRGDHPAGSSLAWEDEVAEGVSDPAFPDDPLDDDPFVEAAVPDAALGGEAEGPGAGGPDPYGDVVLGGRRLRGVGGGHPSGEAAGAEVGTPGRAAGAAGARAAARRHLRLARQRL